MSDDLNDIRVELSEIKLRLTALEIRVGNLADAARTHHSAQMRQLLDRIAARLHTIERHLDLAEG